MINHACMLSHSVVSNSLRPPWTVARQAPLSTGFSRQEYWSGLPCPPSVGLPYSGIKPMSLYVSCFGRQVLDYYKKPMLRPKY